MPSRTPVSLEDAMDITISTLDMLAERMVTIQNVSGYSGDIDLDNIVNKKIDDAIGNLCRRLGEEIHYIAGKLQALRPPYSVGEEVCRYAGAGVGSYSNKVRILKKEIHSNGDLVYTTSQDGSSVRHDDVRPLTFLDNSW